MNILIHPVEPSQGAVSALPATAAPCTPPASGGAGEGSFEQALAASGQQAGGGAGAGVDPQVSGNGRGAPGEAPGKAKDARTEKKPVGRDDSQSGPAQDAAAGMLLPTVPVVVPVAEAVMLPAGVVPAEADKKSTRQIAAAAQATGNAPAGSPVKLPSASASADSAETEAGAASGAPAGDGVATKAALVEAALVEAAPVKAAPGEMKSAATETHAGPAGSAADAVSHASPGLAVAGAHTGEAPGVSGVLGTGNVADTAQASVGKNVTAGNASVAGGLNVGGAFGGHAPGALPLDAGGAPGVALAQTGGGNGQAQGGKSGAKQGGGEVAGSPAPAGGAGLVMPGDGGAMQLQPFASAVDSGGASPAGAGTSSAGLAEAALAAGTQANVAASGGINTARVLASMSGTEMRVGMHSVEFGSISIATTVSPTGIAAQIALDHGALGQALAAHLPGVEEKIGAALGVTARVDVRDTGAALSQGGGSGTGSDSGSGLTGGSRQGGSGQGGGRGAFAEGRGYSITNEAVWTGGAAERTAVTEGRLSIRA